MKKHWKSTLKVIFLLIIVGFLYISLRKNIKFAFGNVGYQELIFFETGIVVFFYTMITYMQVKQLRMSQNLNTLSGLIKHARSVRKIRSDVFRDSQDSKPNFDDLTKLCNFFDEVGHVTYRLPYDSRKIALEQWGEIYIRSWIKLRGFVRKKRKFSIERDYCYFEWLASLSLEYHEDRFPEMELHAYDYEENGFDPRLSYRVGEDRLIERYSKLSDADGPFFRSSTDVEKEFIKGRSFLMKMVDKCIKGKRRSNNGR